MKPLKTAAAVTAELRRLGDPKLAKFLQGFFRAVPGGYGEGDRFLGLKVPTVRSVSRRATLLDRKELAKLLASPLHEARLAGLDIAVHQASRAKDFRELKAWKDFAWKNRAGIDNWDLVDTAIPTLVGRWLLEELRREPASARKWVLARARSRNLWERRTGVLATFTAIRAGRFELTTAVCAALLKDEHDLIHKATGWMLREAGKRDERPLNAFLKKHAHVMPRTMLRYAIEKKSPAERAHWMSRGVVEVLRKSPPFP